MAAARVERRLAAILAACAVAIQRGMAEREADLPEMERIRFRIGVNLGDVIREADGDLYGDGVNVAARLEQLCEPGGVLVSGTAYDQLHGKLDLPLEFSGEQRVKSIERRSSPLSSSFSRSARRPSVTSSTESRSVVPSWSGWNSLRASSRMARRPRWGKSRSTS